MPRYFFPKSARVRKRGAFVEIQRDGKKTSGKALLLFMHAQKKPGPARLGITVSKRVGGAIVRNRVKRLVREVFRLNPTWFPAGRDLVLVARPEAAAMDLAGMTDEIARLCIGARA
jgi:ribonuclease P protein component